MWLRQDYKLWEKRIVGHGATGCKRSSETKAKIRNSFNEERKTSLSRRMKNDNPMFKEEVVAKFLGDNNPSRREDVKQKISDNNCMKNPEIRKKQKEACNTKSEKLRRSKHMKLNNPSFDKEVLKRRVETYCIKLSKGLIKSKSKWKTGYYKDEWYDSSLELLRMQQLDRDENIKNWTKKHGIRIHYNDSIYVPDFLITYKDGTKVLEETKGWIDNSVADKKHAAEEYCLKNGYKYRLLMTEDVNEIENDIRR